MADLEWKDDPRHRVATLSGGHQEEIERLQGTLPPEPDRGIVVLDVRAIEARGWTWSVNIGYAAGGYYAAYVQDELKAVQAIADTPQGALNAAYEQAQRELAK